jgi:hypothetical protein
LPDSQICQPIATLLPDPRGTPSHAARAARKWLVDIFGIENPPQWSA